MQATIENGVVVVRIPLGTPRPSSTGKTYVLASGSAKLLHNGSTITVGANVYTKHPK